MLYSTQQHLQKQLQAHDAVIIAHYYTPPEIQRLAEETGGFVGDSLAMADFGYRHAAQTLLVCGVRFMGESAKILSPHKRVLMPTLQATCSLDLGCPDDQFALFCSQHPKRTVVVYANTSAKVKAQADWVVTSSNAIDIVAHLHAQGCKILWAPDRYLGSYIQKKTGADMLVWQGSCIVHEEFKRQALDHLRQQYPEAALLVHPESPPEILEVADCIGSTAQLLQASKELSHKIFIVATDRGIFYKMQQASPHKTFIAAPTLGQGATCRSCGQCPWMAMNTIDQLTQSLHENNHEILVEDDIIARAVVPLKRMLDFTLCRT